jgi:hypothetical protein
MIRLTLLLAALLFSCAKFSAEDETLPVKDYSHVNTDALAYCKDKGFCTDYYFLVDLGIHSGRNRFFVYDFKAKSIVAQNLVTHGACDAFEANATPNEKAKLSNRIDSHCSAKGKYKVAKRDYSSWGINVKYWLDGLEEGNSNARSRVIVLHSCDAVANKEIYPDYSPLSWGCPAVSDAFMRVLDAKLQATKKPVLLWIVD